MYIKLYRFPDVTIGAQLKLDANDGIKTMKDFKREIKEANGDLISLSEKFGESSTQAAAAAKRVAELRDRLDDARKLSDAFNPDQKFLALTNSLNGAVGGFTALTGVMGLFGVESEDVQKTLLKVQSALALSQGLNQVGEAVKSFKDLGAVIQSSTVFLKANELANKAAGAAMKLFGFEVEATSTSFKVLKGAIVATGIGLVVVLIGELVSAFNELSSAAEKAAEAEKEATEIRTRFTNIGLQGELDYINRQSQLDISRAKLKGASEKEIFDIQQKWQEQRINSQKRALGELRETDEGYLEIKKGLKNEEAKLEVDSNNFLIQQREKAIEAAKKKAELDKQNKELGSLLGLKENKDLSQDPAVLEERERNKLLLNERAILTQKTIDFSDLAAKVQQGNAKQTAETERIMAEARAQAANDVGSALGALSDLVGKQTAAGKVLAIAQATINTWVGVSEVLRAKSVIPEPFGTISKIANVAVIIASGLKAVKEIVKTPVPGASGGAGGGASIGATAAPIQPQLGFTNTRLDANQLNQIGNAAAVRAFVVESDVSGSQERIRRLNRAARI